jgi:hypothetical protein
MIVVVVVAVGLSACARYAGDTEQRADRADRPEHRPSVRIVSIRHRCDRIL